MTVTTIVPIYAAVLALLFVALSFRTLGLRRRLRIAVGDGGNQTMLRATRAHANFAEYAPLALLLLYFVESAGMRSWVVHVLCMTLVLGRCSHAYGVSQVDENFVFRVVGMSLTFAVLISAALGLLGLRLGVGIG